MVAASCMLQPWQSYRNCLGQIAQVICLRALSSDGESWVAIKTISGNQSKGVIDFPGLFGAGRYVRIYCTQTSQGSENYSLYDFQVYGTKVADLAQERPAQSSSVESSTYSPERAVDGNSSTRWSSGQWMQDTGTGWISVDLGAPYNISEVRLNWETAYAVDYQIELSSDGENWVAIKTISGNQSKGVVDFPGLSGAGRYVRIYCTQTSQGSDNYSLYDFQVYGSALALYSLQPAGSLTPLAAATQTTAAIPTTAAFSSSSGAGLIASGQGPKVSHWARISGPLAAWPGARSAHHAPATSSRSSPPQQHSHRLPIWRAGLLPLAGRGLDGPRPVSSRKTTT
jgi:hypothetical protein